MKQALKIKLENQTQFKKAWNALVKLGYHCPEELVLDKATYLYAYADGLIRAEFIEAVDQSSVKAGLDYFTAIEHKEVSLEELFALLKQDENEKSQFYIQLIKQERPLFEENYVKNGGDLQFLTWDECDNGAGDYQPNWEKLSLVKHENAYEENVHNDKIMEHATHVRSCLTSWVECAKSKAIPVGFYLMPMQPSEEMLKKAELEFQDLEFDIDDIQDRIVFSHQAMISVLSNPV